MPDFLIDALAGLTVPGAVCLSVTAAGVVSIPALLLAGATRGDFDPRPAVRRALDSRAGEWLLVEVVRGKATVHGAFDWARLVAVSGLLVLVTHLDPSSPSVPKKGAL